MVQGLRVLRIVLYDDVRDITLDDPLRYRAARHSTADDCDLFASWHALLQIQRRRDAEQANRPEAPQIRLLGKSSGRRGVRAESVSF